MIRTSAKALGISRKAAADESCRGRACHGWGEYKQLVQHLKLEEELANVAGGGSVMSDECWLITALSRKKISARSQESEYTKGITRENPVF